MSRRADQGPKTIEQIHKEAKIEEQEEQRKVLQLMTKDKRRPGKVKAKLAAPFTHFTSSGLRGNPTYKEKNLWGFFLNEQRELEPDVAEAGKGTDVPWVGCGDFEGQISWLKKTNHRPTVFKLSIHANHV